MVVTSGLEVEEMVSCCLMGMEFQFSKNSVLKTGGTTLNALNYIEVHS